MSADLCFSGSQWTDLQRHLLADQYEHAAILICGTAKTATGLRLLVQDVLPAAEPSDAVLTTTLGIDVSPMFIARAAKLARQLDGTVVLCHSHPFPGPVFPSALDLRTELDLCGRALHARLQPRPVGSLILGPDGFDGRVWHGSDASAIERVVVNGARIDVLGNSPASPAPQHSRQILAWGVDGQRTLAASRVGIVGCGGTGSHIALQLAHLGVGEIVLVDFDAVEVSNLSRLVGVGPDYVGRFKTEAIANAIHNVAPTTRVREIRSSVLDVNTETLADCDVLVSATDSHGSRAWLNEFSEQYLITLIDLGVELQPGPPIRSGGGVRIVRPGEACLQCAGTLSSALVREEFLSSAERETERRHGYLVGDASPTPSVIALNGVVASLAVLEVCQALAGLLGGAGNRLLYRADRRSLTTTSTAQKDYCYVCGLHGLVGRGDGRVMPRRNVAAA